MRYIHTGEYANMDAWQSQQKECPLYFSEYNSYAVTEKNTLSPLFLLIFINPVPITRPYMTQGTFSMLQVLDRLSSYLCKGYTVWYTLPVWLHFSDNHVNANVTYIWCIIEYSQKTCQNIISLWGDSTINICTQVRNCPTNCSRLKLIDHHSISLFPHASSYGLVLEGSEK